MLRLRHIQYFVTASEQGSFRKAAALLNIQESAVSRRIRDLEDRLGASLFHRHPGGVSLTVAGQRQAKALAQIYRPDPSEQASTSGEHPVLLVVGHTDATGSADHNQALSERRAQAMGRVLAQAGIDPSDIYFQGAGASRPHSFFSSD